MQFNIMKKALINNMQFNIIKKALINNIQFNIIQKDVNKSCTWSWVKMSKK